MTTGRTRQMTPGERKVSMLIQQAIDTVEAVIVAHEEMPVIGQADQAQMNDRLTLLEERVALARTKFDEAMFGILGGI